MRIAYFVSSHGFGHAARSCAVIDYLIQIDPKLHVDIYSETTREFFVSSLTGNIDYFSCKTDVGLLQLSPLLCDIEGSFQVIDKFLKFDSNHLQQLANHLKTRQIDLVICDISPLGLVVAEKSGIPSLLIENFTWDWIYEDFVSGWPQYHQLIKKLERINTTASWRVRAKPVCGDIPQAHKLVDPLSRKPRKAVSVIRYELGIRENEKLVLLTQGGIPGETQFLNNLKEMKGIRFMVTGAKENRREDNILLLKNDASTYLPDFLNASDAVIGKVGYSTVAEVWRAGLPMMYFTRESFRESASLATFIDHNMNGIGLSEKDYDRGVWLDDIKRLLSFRRLPPTLPDSGLHDIGKFIKAIV